VWDFIRNKGFFGLVIKKEYGGKGFSAAAHSQIVLKIASRSTSAGVTVMVPNSLGPGELLEHYGTTEQKNYYLPRLARGEEIPCFALTGPTAGSDATSIPDQGVVCMGEYQGQLTLGIKLTKVNKRYITLAPIATLVGLAFVLSDPEGLLGNTGRVGITCALLPRTHPGIEIGNRLLPLDQVFMNGTIRIDETFIPMEWVIGGQAMCGEGWRMLVECLSIGRSISLPACSTANSLLATVTTSAYARIREQFKVSLSQFEGVQAELAKMSGLTYLMNATRQFTVAAVDNGVRPAVASAIAKYHLTENGRTVVNCAMDVHGGRAIIMGPQNYLARMYQGVPIAITVEGANILTRNLMIFGQGAMRCHPYIRKMYEALMRQDGLTSFDQVLWQHMSYFMHNKVRAIAIALSGGLLAQGYRSKFNCYYKGISRLASAQALVNDSALLLFGGSLKVRERLSARLGDVISYLYMASACLKYYQDMGSPASQELYLQWSLEHCLYHAQQALVEALANFPHQAVGKIYRFILFPYGLPFKQPADKLEQALASDMVTDNPLRQVFKSLAYVQETTSDVVGRMEVAFQKILHALPIKAKIAAAIKQNLLQKATVMQQAQQAVKLGIISEEELAILNTANELALEVIQVDEFGPTELGPRNAHPSWH
jgi:alkylation response protein AidB-like acyl-CoA dehydrogenase